MTDNEDDRPYTRKELESLLDSAVTKQRQEQIQEQIEEIKRLAKEERQLREKGLWLAVAGLFGAVGAALMDWIQHHLFK